MSNDTQTTNVKNIAIAWANIQNLDDICFGNPEMDTRYKVWRVPVLDDTDYSPL